MEKQGRTITFSNGEIKIRLGYNFIAKRKKFGKAGLNISYYDPCNDDEVNYGNFDPETTISIDAYDPCKVVVITSDKENNKVVLTKYCADYPKPRAVTTKNADKIELFGDSTYILRDSDSARIYSPFAGFYSAETNGTKVFKSVDTKIDDLEDKNSVIVEEVICSKANPGVYDTIHYRLNLATSSITSDVYSELQDRTINLEQLSKEMSKKRGHYVDPKTALFSEIVHYVELLALHLSREELTHEEVVKRIGLSK